MKTKEELWCVKHPALFSCLWGELLFYMCYVLGMSTIELSERYKDIAQQLIREREDLHHLEGVRIAFLASDQEKKSNRKTVFADCRKVSDQYRWCCPYDFMITVYEPNCVMYGFDEIMYHTLLWHELLHCGVEESEDGQKFYLIPHDIEEFDKIIEAVGSHWQAQNLKGADSLG